MNWTIYSIKHIHVHAMANITVYAMINDKNWPKSENNMTNFKVLYLTSISMLYLNIYNI